MEMPVFRGDLKTRSIIGTDGELRYLIEDPETGEVFVFGEEEHFICSMLDGTVRPEDIVSEFKRRFGSQLMFERLDSFVHMLGDKQLLVDYPARRGSRLELFQFRSPETWKRWRLLNPEKLMVWLAKNLNWCYTWPFHVAVILVFVAAAGVLFFNLGRFLWDVRSLVSPLNIFQILVVTYLFVNIPQEVARGISAIRFKGYPYEFGVWLAYNIMPRFYCLTRIFSIPEKSKRCWVLFSPSYYSVMSGSVGVLMWQMTSADSALHRFGVIITSICVIDSVFRLNFLWPSEAHYILSNWLGIRDFRKRAIEVFKSWLFRRPLPEPLASSDKRLFMIYGFLTLIVTFPTVAVVAYYIGKGLIGEYAGIGGLIFISLISIKYRNGIFGIFKEKNMVESTEVKNKSRFTRRTRRIIIIASLILIMLLPYPYEPGGSFEILPLESVELHSLVSGQIIEVMVKEGSIVKKGDVQAVIDVHEHKKNLEVTLSQLDKAIADLKLLEKGAKPEEIKKAKEILETAKVKAEYSIKERDRLSNLFSEGVVSEEEYDAAVHQADFDQKNLNIAKANLELIESGARPEEIEAQKAVVRDYQSRVDYYKKNMENTELLAPVNGSVVTPYVDMKIGQYLREGDLFAVYNNMDEIKAEIMVPEVDIAEVEIGKEVKLRPDSYPTKFFKAEVTSKAPDVMQTPDGKYVRVIVEVQDPNKGLLSGMTGKAKIDGEWKPLIVAFTRPIVRFIMVEVWSWLP